MMYLPIRKELTLAILMPLCFNFLRNSCIYLRMFLYLVTCFLRITVWLLCQLQAVSMIHVPVYSYLISKGRRNCSTLWPAQQLKRDVAPAHPLPSDVVMDWISCLRNYHCYWNNSINFLEEIRCVRKVLVNREYHDKTWHRFETSFKLNLKCNILTLLYVHMRTSIDAPLQTSKQ